MDAFFGGPAAARSPRPAAARRRRGQDALIRLEVELAEAAFGVTRELKVDTAVVCTHLPAARAPRPAPTRAPARPAAARGEVAHVQRSFLGEIRTLRPCAACRGFGTIIPDPCRECSGDGRVRSRRTLTVKIPAGVDTGTRVQLTGEGEVGPGGGPAGDLYVEIHVEPAPDVHPPRQRPALHGHAADDGGRPRHHADAADPRGRRVPPRADDRPRRPDVRPRHPPRHPVGHRAGAPRARRAGPARRSRRPRRHASPWRRRPGSTRARRSCCASSRRSAARSSPPARTRRRHKSMLRPAPRRLQQR